MPDAQTVYRSSNGDDWVLEYEASGEPVVVHRANGPSGGAVARMPAHEFLQRNSGSPEAAAVREALGRESPSR